MPGKFSTAPLQSRLRKNGWDQLALWSVRGYMMAAMKLLAISFAAATLAFAQPAPPAHPYPRIDDTIGYKADPSWPAEKPPGGEWTAPMSSVAIAPDGNIWTFNRGKIPVQVYTPDGKLVKYWGQEGLFRNPHTVRFDAAGNLWIADTLTQTV